MGHVYPVEPPEGWREGDLAYCVNDKLWRGSCSPKLEKGRVYRVAKAWKPFNIAHHGLTLQGFSMGDALGFWSNRFIKVGPAGGRLQRIAAATEYTTAHYWPAIPPKDRIAEKLEAHRAAVAEQG